MSNSLQVLVGGCLIEGELWQLVARHGHYKRHALADIHPVDQLNPLLAVLYIVFRELKYRRTTIVNLWCDLGLRLKYLKGESKMGRSFRGKKTIIFSV